MNEKKSMMSEFAVASLVVGLISLVNFLGVEKAIVAIVFGVLALRRMNKDSHLSGRNIALAGVIIGSLAIVFTIFFFVKFYPQIKERAIQMQNQYEGGASGASQQQELIPTPR